MFFKHLFFACTALFLQLMVHTVYMFIFQCTIHRHTCTVIIVLKQVDLSLLTDLVFGLRKANCPLASVCKRQQQFCVFLFGQGWKYCAECLCVFHIQSLVYFLCVCVCVFANSTLWWEERRRSEHIVLYNLMYGEVSTRKSVPSFMWKTVQE